MPESRGRARPTKRDDEPQPQNRGLPAPNPTWWVPVMCGLMIFGVVWIATFYISQGEWPIPISYWNLAIGLGAIMGGFAMATRWR